MTKSEHSKSAIAPMSGYIPSATFSQPKMSTTAGVSDGVLSDNRTEALEEIMKDDHSKSKKVKVCGNNLILHFLSCIFYSNYSHLFANLCIANDTIFNFKEANYRECRGMSYYFCSIIIFILTNHALILQLG